MAKDEKKDEPKATATEAPFLAPPAAETPPSQSKDLGIEVVQVIGRFAGLAALLGAAFALGLDNIRNFFRSALGLVEEAILTSITLGRLSWPYIRAGMAGLSAIFGGSVLLIGLGLYLESSFLVVAGGLVFLAVLLVVFSGLEIILGLLGQATNAGEKIIGYGLEAVTVGLSWLGLARPRRGKFELLREELWPIVLRDHRRRTIVLWLLPVGTLAVFPFWHFAILLLPTLILLAILGNALADWRGYDVEVFWKIMFGGVGVAWGLLIPLYLFSTTGHDLRLAIGRLDRQMHCAWFNSIHPDCRERRLQALAERLAKTWGKAIEMAERAAIPTPVSGNGYNGEAADVPSESAPQGVAPLPTPP